MQHALTTRNGGRVALKKGVHQAVEKFSWMLQDIASRPTRIAELVPLSASAEGFHWRYKLPDDIINSLVTDENLSRTISNSDLELTGGLLHLEALAQTFDIRERTILSNTDNLATLFWQRKGSTTTDKCPPFSSVFLTSTSGSIVTSHVTTISLVSQIPWLMMHLVSFVSMTHNFCITFTRLTTYRKIAPFSPGPHRLKSFPP